MSNETLEIENTSLDIKPAWPGGLSLCDDSRNEAQRTLFFSANTPAGDIGLSITGDDLDSLQCSPLHQRLELSRSEHVIQRLEDWLETPLDLEPVNDIASPMVLKIKVAGKVSRSIGVYMSAGTWLLAGQSGVELDANGITLVWPEFDAILVLDKFHLSSDELNAIQIGSILLLPQSFEPLWYSTLLVPAAEARLDGRIAFPTVEWQTESLFSEEQSDVRDRLICEPNDGAAFYECTISSQLFFESRHTKICEMLGNQLRNDQCVMHSGGAQAAGDLMPIGKGYGLHISALSGTESLKI